MQDNGNKEGPGVAGEPFAAYAEEYRDRFLKHYDELKWLYCELYENRMDAFETLCGTMYRYYRERKKDLKRIDGERLERPDWYKGNQLVGMMLYVDAFAGNLEGVRKKLDYIEECGVNYLHLMPFLDSPEKDNDGGYAVSDFRKVKPSLGTMEQLSRLADDCRGRGISLCMDFVMNHTSMEHEWARRARNGEKEYQDRYYFYDDYSIPAEFEKTVPQVFPTTAPGNFTWLPDMGKFVMTSFYPYQWDLNYREPRVFNDMMYDFLYLANRGMDMIRLDAVPYIWKELGTDCRNLPQVHTIVRMMRMIAEIVCPSVILLGEVVMEPVKVAPYFGTPEKPECHLLYNVTTMCTTWHTVATKDVRLLRRQLDAVNALPKQYVFLNYLRCHDDIGWGLDYGALAQWGITEVPHKKFLSDYFQGLAEGSVSRGELYNADPSSGDARQCGTTASLCGIEKAGLENDAEAMARAVRLDLTLHAMMFMQTGVPLLYSGDEIAQVNDYSYKDDPEKADDSRYLHRGKMRWDLAGHIEDPSTPEGQVFRGLGTLIALRRTHPAFGASAQVQTLDTGDDGVLAIGRYLDGQRIVGVFNFTGEEKSVALPHAPGTSIDLFTGKKYTLERLHIPAFGCYYMEQGSTYAPSPLDQ